MPLLFHHNLVRGQTSRIKINGVSWRSCPAGLSATRSSSREGSQAWRDCADAYVGVFRDVLPIEAVQPPDLPVQKAVEGAVDPPQLVESGPEGGPQHPPAAAEVDGELHFQGQAHARPRRGAVDKAGEEPGQQAGPDLFLGDHPALAQGDDLFAGSEDVAGLVNGLDVPPDQGEVALARLDKVGGNGVAGVGPSAGLNDNFFSLVRVKIHSAPSFHFWAGKE